AVMKQVFTRTLADDQIAVEARNEQTVQDVLRQTPRARTGERELRIPAHQQRRARLPARKHRLPVALDSPAVNDEAVELLIANDRSQLGGIATEEFGYVWLSGRIL